MFGTLKNLHKTVKATFLSIYLSTLSICIIHINIYTHIYTCINIYMIYIYIKYLTYITYTYTHTGIFVDADIYVL